jgi:hypothetical protein
MYYIKICTPHDFFLIVLLVFSSSKQQQQHDVCVRLFVCISVCVCIHDDFFNLPNSLFMLGAAICMCVYSICKHVYVYIHTFHAILDGWYHAPRLIFILKVLKAYVRVCLCLCVSTFESRSSMAYYFTTAILIIFEGRFQVFQRFCSSKLVPKTVESRFVALNYYENVSFILLHIIFNSCR